MSTKPLERLLFIQGGRCFFCNQPLPPNEASVEHLLAKSNGGGNDADNCVACCKTINAVLGSMSLRDKFQVVLNQKGQFKCPAKVHVDKVATLPKVPPAAQATAKPNGQSPGLKSGAANTASQPAKTALGEPQMALILADLRRRGTSKPGSLTTLKGSIAALFKKSLSELELDALIQQLQTSGKLRLQENKIIYTL